ncbi:MAG: hypothetical protein LE180_06150, partial [Endomicrobium sp.]|nr:hypothetical protein [Endomicrobium sp.]
FADENSLYDIIYKSLKNALTSHAHPEISVANTPFLGERQKHNLYADFTTSKSRQSTVYLRESKPKQNYIPSKQTYNIDTYANVFAKQEELASEKFDDTIKIIGQVFGTYIIAENKGDLYIFDQHAVAERVRYELYLEQMKNQSIKLQQMLLPENFDFAPSVSEVLKTNINLFNELGIGIEEFGQNSFRITAYPALLGNISMIPIVETIVADIEDDKNVEIEQKRDKIIKSACRASIKAGDNVAFVEAKKLINDIFKCEQPFTCPHGRPTAYKISQNELEKFFKRK